MTKKRKKLLQARSVFFVFVLLCVLIGAFCFQYYDKLQKIIREESSGYLQEVSRQISSNVGRTINDSYAVLETIASNLQGKDNITSSEIKPFMEVQRKNWNFQDVLLIDADGVAYNTSGQKIVLGGESYLRQAVINKESSMSMSQVINGKECIVFAIPLDGVTYEGAKMAALALSYDPTTFDEILSMTSFNEQAYSQIIKKDGTFVIRSTSPYAGNTGYNVLTTIEQTKMDSGSNMDKLRADIAADVTGQIGFTSNDLHKYMVYTPIAHEEWFLLTFVPVSVVNAKSDMLLKITMLICGLITLTFAGLIAFLMFMFYRNRRRLEKIAFVDTVTGGNTIQKFYELAQEELANPNHPQYALVYTNLQKFKVLNAQLGRKTCDVILSSLYTVISDTLGEDECMGRLFADNFCILMKCESETMLVERLRLWYASAETFLLETKPTWGLPITEFGIYIIDNDTLEFNLMIDQAKLALRESSHPINDRLRYAVYNDELRRRLFRDKALEDRMASALSSGEFQVYLQPKYRTETEEVGGAEALTRWITPEEGMIFPDEFIPLFEKNGFIIQLDLWVFEQVCKTMQGWINKGLTPMKISVNCSRVHLKNSDFFKSYLRIFKKFSIPPSLIEIEFTESVVMEDSERLNKIIDDIHSVGFCCSMDDFGSGYSSLNLIQNIPVDTLKLDKIFFHSNAGNPERMWSVVHSIINLAKALNMEIVAEGVEQREEVDELRRIGCDLIQGYVFAKPMPIADFEKLSFGK